MKNIQANLRTWRTELAHFYVVIRAAIERIPMLAVGLILSFCFWVCATTTFAGNKYAVCVGINKYKALPNLSCCVTDATYFYTNLMERGGWKQTNMTILKDSGATKTAIRQAISNYASKAVAGDVFVYLQSSHAGQISGKNTYLCVYDENYNDVSTAYNDYEIATDLASFATGVKVAVVVEACHSGGLFKGKAAYKKPFDLSSSVSSIMEENRAQCLARDAREIKNSIEPSEIGWVTSADYNEYSPDGGFYDTDVWLNSKDEGSITGGVFLASFIWAQWDGSADIKSGYGDNDGYADPYECWAVASTRCKN